MPYNSLISRTDSAALIPEEVSREIIQGAVEQSTVLRLARRLPNMTRAQQRMPVLSALPTAYFVTGDTGLKQSSEVAWDNVYINAEEIAVIVPIPEAVLDDADYDIWGEVKPRIEEAVGVVIDAAILVGTNAPASWPDDLFTGATAASHVVDHSSDAQTDYYDEIAGAGGVMALVEEDGYTVSGHVAVPAMRAALRGLRESGGSPIFVSTMQESTRYQLFGQPMEFVRNGAVNPASQLMFTGEWEQLVYSVRQDMSYKLLTEAVIQDGSGNILYNLPQQDMVALRAVIRLGWALPNPITRMNQTAATRYPFAILVP